MSSNTRAVVDRADREEEIFRARLKGRSVRAIAREFACEIVEVEEIIEKMCAPASAAMRRQALALDLQRLDELQTVFYEKAQDGDTASAAIVIKLSERRASLLGLDVPASVRGDAVQLAIITPPQPESTTDRIRRALDLLAAERLPAPSNGHGEEMEAAEREEPR